MKRLPAILIIIGVALLGYWIFIRIANSFMDFRTSKFYLILAILMILAAIFIKLKGKTGSPAVSKKKILSGALCVIAFGLFLYSYKPQIENFIFQYIDRCGIKIVTRIYWREKVVLKTKWLGVTSIQYPNDNWVMQEIISEIKPDFIVETGTANGGTTLFYATVLEKVNPKGKVITVDIDPRIEEAGKFQVFRDKVEVIKGDSVSAEVIDAISKRVKNCKVLVTLDSLHTKKHVLKELNLYSNFVSLNSYIVVQDTHLGEQKDSLRHVKGGGPWEAMEEFLKNNKNFEIDHSKEKYFITQHPSGFLKRIR